MPIKVGNKWVERPHEKAEREKKETLKRKVQELRESKASVTERLDAIEKYLGL